MTGKSSASSLGAGTIALTSASVSGACSTASHELVNSVPRSPKLRSVPQPAQNGA